MSDKPTVNEAAWPGAFAAVGKAWERAQRNQRPLLIMLAIYGVCGLLNAIALSQDSGRTGGFELLATLILLVATPTYALSLADNKKISFEKAMRTNVATFLSVLVAGILLALVVGVSILLLVFPVIWAIGWFALLTYPIVEGKAGIIESFKHSKKLSRNHIGKVWGLVGVSLLATIITLPLTAIPFLGDIIAALATGLIGIIFSIAGAMLYRWLQHQHPAESK